MSVCINMACGWLLKDCVRKLASNFLKGAFYTGLTGGTFKKRWSQHNHDFRNQNNKTSTTLSAHIWELKEKGKPYNIKWEIRDRAAKFNPVNRKCRLCLKEIYCIMFKPESSSLNHRKELFSTCRHRTQNLIVNCN